MTQADIATPSLEQLKAQVSDKIEACYQRAERYFKRTFPRPEISFRLRGRAAGSAWMQANELRFQPTLLEQNPQAFITQVVPHEISHLLAWQLYGKVPAHGRQWQALMVELYQLSPDRTHDFDTSRLGLREFNYRCDCGEVKFSARRHHNAQQGTQYRCRTCNQSLSWQGAPSQEAGNTSPNTAPAPRATPAKKANRFAYHCGCGRQWLSSIRHRRVQQGTRYQCQRCKSLLQAISA